MKTKPIRFEKNALPGMLWVGKTEAGNPIVYGFAMVSKVRGPEGEWLDYFDLQGDHIPSAVIEKCAAGFMKLGGAGKVMHNGAAVGQVIFAMPFTEGVIDKLEPEAAAKLTRLGLVIGMETTEEFAGKARAGEYTGFSIGGWVTESKEAAKVKASMIAPAINALLDTSKRAARVGKATASSELGEKPRRVILELKLDEISLVDFPAQEPATIATVKRRTPIVKAWVDESTVPNMLTTSEAGHQHMISAGPMHTAGETSTSEGDIRDADGNATVGYHSHPWIRDAATGVISIGETLGHTHEVEAVAPVAIAVEVVLTPEQLATAVSASASTEAEAYDDKAAPAESGKVDNAPEPGHNDLNRENATVDHAKMLAAVLCMSATEFAHAQTLNGAERDAFINADSATRKAAVKAADDANPIVHTDKRGHVYRAKDDRRIVDSAKAADEAMEKVAQLAIEKEDAQLEKRAVTELPSIGKSVKARAAMIRAVDSIEKADPEAGKECREMLSSLEQMTKAGLGRVSGGGGTHELNGAQAQFDAALVKFAEARKQSPVMATEAFLSTDEGRSLHKAITEERRATQAVRGMPS